ncbi:hypothetical protein SAMD00023353_0800900 [Rosellinia necatrix]|uniref:Uncharacterized protein n=1 Tax=Rosellinia necatrix TaxID=77044 RepID=A0A1W2TAX5_ROSNE|nr:hypothetical protein SAMD00023353_0800900 [Rosellinia necatrix]
MAHARPIKKKKKDTDGRREQPKPAEMPRGYSTAWGTYNDPYSLMTAAGSEPAPCPTGTRDGWTGRRMFTTGGKLPKDPDVPRPPGRVSPATAAKDAREFHAAVYGRKPSPLERFLGKFARNSKRNDR